MKAVDDEFIGQSFFLFLLNVSIRACAMRWRCRVWWIATLLTSRLRSIGMYKVCAYLKSIMPRSFDSTQGFREGHYTNIVKLLEIQT